MLVFSFMIANIGEPPWGYIHSRSFLMKPYLSSKYSSCRLWHLHVCRSYFLYLFFLLFLFHIALIKEDTGHNITLPLMPQLSTCLASKMLHIPTQVIWHITAELHIILSEVFLLLFLDKFHSSCFDYTTWVYCYISYWEK